MLPPTFSQPERRSFIVPILIALVVLAAALAWINQATKSTVTVKLLKTDVLPTKTVFKSDSIVLGPGETSYTLFVIETVQVKNGRKQSISLDDFSMTLTDSTGAELTQKALQKQELPKVEISFPKLKGLVTGPLLVRDEEIAPGQSSQGVLVFSLAVPQDLWDSRRSAQLEIAPYHLDPLTLTVPK